MRRILLTTKNKNVMSRSVCIQIKPSKWSVLVFSKLYGRVQYGIARVRPYFRAPAVTEKPHNLSNSSPSVEKFSVKIKAESAKSLSFIVSIWYFLKQRLLSQFKPFLHTIKWKKFVYALFVYLNTATQEYSEKKRNHVFI